MISPTSRAIRRGMVVAALAALATIGLLLTARGPATAQPTKQHVVDEDALWNDMDSILMPPPERRTSNLGVPEWTRYVVIKGEDLEAVVVHCAGDCEGQSCGLPFHPGCQASATCERKVYRVAVDIDNETQAYAWLRE